MTHNIRNLSARTDHLTRGAYWTALPSAVRKQHCGPEKFRERDQLHETVWDMGRTNNSALMPHLAERENGPKRTSPADCSLLSPLCAEIGGERCTNNGKKAAGNALSLHLDKQLHACSQLAWHSIVLRYAASHDEGPQKKQGAASFRALKAVSICATSCLNKRNNKRILPPPTYRRRSASTPAHRRAVCVCSAEQQGNI